MQMPNLIISDEEDLFRALERLLDEERKGTDLEDWEVTFNGWPRYEITIRGEDFDGGIPTRIMPALLKLQEAVDEGYSRLVYGEAKRLSKEEKQKTELIVHVRSGSTTFVSNVWDVLNSIGQQALKNMDGSQTLIGLVMIAAMASGTAGLYFWLNYRKEAKRLDVGVAQSAEETRRLEIMERALEQSSQIIRDQVEVQNKAIDSLVKRLQPNDEIVANGESVIDGEAGRKLLRAPRKEPVDSRLDGTFAILTVHSGGVRGGYKLQIKKLDDDLELTVNVPEGTLAEQQILTLQEGEWGKRPLVMKLNIKKRGDRIVEATLIEAGLTAP
jgi:hypothetical protein